MKAACHCNCQLSFRFGGCQTSCQIKNAWRAQVEWQLAVQRVQCRKEVQWVGRDFDLHVHKKLMCVNVSGGNAGECFI